MHGRIAHRFRRPEVRERARRYFNGLLSHVQRKNGWQMAEEMGEAAPHGAQRILNGSRWDADAVRDDLREYVVEHLGDEQSGVLILDETGFLKKGESSVGVARQYTGTAGKRENAQVGVFLCYASDEGAAFIDRELYLPAEWTDDRPRLWEAGVPEEVGFATKGELAKEMLWRAFEVEVPARWVVGDTVYGMSRGLRGWLEQRGCPYVMAVTATKGVYREGHQRQVRKIARDLPEEDWFRASAGEGSKGERLYDWTCVALPAAETNCAGDRAGRWLLVRRWRSLDDPQELAYYLCYGPAQTTVDELINIAGKRWRIEETFEATKSEVGLDEYEIRKWGGWYRHITLCLLAHAYLTAVRSAAEREEEAVKGGISSRVSTPN
ncbi:MAG: IS701 family transposase [Rubrobacter sp.]|nr:IS701 family transposase [Rubrobacter sp.]